MKICLQYHEAELCRDAVLTEALNNIPMLEVGLTAKLRENLQVDRVFTEAFNKASRVSIKGYVIAQTYH